MNQRSFPFRFSRFKTSAGLVVTPSMPGLQGVIATGTTLESCRDQPAEVVEEWVLVLVRGLCIPRLGSTRVQVRRAS